MRLHLKLPSLRDSFEKYALPILSPAYGTAKVLSKLGGQQKDPASAADPYMQKAIEATKSAYQPYIEQGQAQYPEISKQYSEMSSDPAAYLANIMKGYEASPGYQYKLGEMQKAAGNTAAAGGMRGSIQDISQEAQLANMLSSEDMQNWLNNVMGIKGAGLGGQQHLYDTGFGAASGMGSDLSNIYGSQAQLGYLSQLQKNQAAKNKLGLFGGLGGAGIGGALGGLPGAAFGSGIGSMLGGLFD